MDKAQEKVQCGKKRNKNSLHITMKKIGAKRKDSTSKKHKDNSK